VNDIETEMGDRFGPLPVEVHRLLDLARLRIAASALSIDSISKQPGIIVVGHHDIHCIQKWRQACLLAGQEVRIVENKTVVLPLNERDASDEDCLFETCKNIFRVKKS
jgi:transcription-repair coupling factor (superfamily II helicase)